MQIIYYQSDTLLTLGGLDPLTNSVDGVATATATVTAKIYKKSDGAQLTPTITLAAVGGSTGKYQGVLPDTHSGLAPGMKLEIVWEADDGSNKKLLKRTQALCMEAKD